MEKLRLRNCSQTYLDYENIEAPFGSGIKLINATLNLNLGCIFFFLKNQVFSLIRAQKIPIHLVFLNKTLQFFLLGE